MELRQLDANALVSLDLLLQEKSVTAAARRQGVSQSAMSQTLRRLRGMLGDPLLVRAGHGMELTTRAASLREPLHRLFAELERVLAEEPEFAPATSQRVMRIAATDYAAPILLPRLLACVGEQGPGVDVHVLGAAIERPLDPLREGALDLIVGMLPPRAVGLETQLLWKETFVVLVRRGHPLIRSRDRLARFAAARHLLVSPRGSAVGHVDELLAARGMKRRVVAALPFFLVAPSIVAETDLVLTLPRRIADGYASHLDLVTLEPPLELGSFDVRMAWSSRADSDPANRWLRALVATVAAA